MCSYDGMWFRQPNTTKQISILMQRQVQSVFLIKLQSVFHNIIAIINLHIMIFLFLMPVLRILVLWLINFTSNSSIVRRLNRFHKTYSRYPYDTTIKCEKWDHGIHWSLPKVQSFLWLTCLSHSFHREKRWLHLSLCCGRKHSDIADRLRL